jgi:hypothetical protein
MRRRRSDPGRLACTCVGGADHLTGAITKSAKRRPKFISVTSFPALTHRGRSPPGRQSVDRNSFRSPCRARDSGSVQPCPIGSTLLVDRNSFRSPCRARDSESVQPCPIGSTLLVDRNSFRSPCRARDSESVQPCPIGSTLLVDRKFISVTSFLTLTHRGRSPPGRQSVDRNSFRSPCRARDSGSVQPCPIGSTLLVDRNSFRSLLSSHSLIAGEARLVGKA